MVDEPITLQELRVRDVQVHSRYQIMLNDSFQVLYQFCEMHLLVLWTEMARHVQDVSYVSRRRLTDDVTFDPDAVRFQLDSMLRMPSYALKLICGILRTAVSLNMNDCHRLMRRVYHLVYNEARITEFWKNRCEQPLLGWPAGCTSLSPRYHHNSEGTSVFGFNAGFSLAHSLCSCADGESLPLGGRSSLGSAYHGLQGWSQLCCAIGLSRSRFSWPKMLSRTLSAWAPPTSRLARSCLSGMILPLKGRQGLSLTLVE